MSVCGTPQHYWAGCREPECRAAHRAYEAERVKRKRQRAGMAFTGIPKADPLTVKHIIGPDTYTLEEIRRFRDLVPKQSTVDSQRCSSSDSQAVGTRITGMKLSTEIGSTSTTSARFGRTVGQRHFTRKRTTI